MNEGTHDHLMPGSFPAPPIFKGKALGTRIKMKYRSHIEDQCEDAKRFPFISLFIFCFCFFFLFFSCLLLCSLTLILINRFWTLRVDSRQTNSWSGFIGITLSYSSNNQLFYLFLCNFRAWEIAWILASNIEGLYRKTYSFVEMNNGVRFNQI